MLGIAPYPTFGQFMTALRGFDLREEGDEQTIQPTLDPNVTFIAQKTHGNSFRGRGIQRGRGNRREFKQRRFHTQLQGSNKQNENSKKNPCQICGKNNYSALSCFYRWDYS